MKQTLARPSTAVTANGITWLEAPPPEIVVAEDFEIVTRWVMEAGAWLNAGAFIPRINLVTSLANTGLRERIQESAPPPGTGVICPLRLIDSMTTDRDIVGPPLMHAGDLERKAGR